MGTLQTRAMSSRSILLSIVILIVLAILLFIGLTSSYPETVRRFMRAIAPPKDLYDFLINEDLDVRERGLIKRFEFRNKYSGRHDIGILLDKFSDDLYFKPFSQRYILKLKMEVNFYLQNSLVLSRVVENKYDPFIGRKGNGFSFITYEAPKDLPINELITCEVKVIEPDKQLYAAYGSVRFYIRKMSDK